MEFSLPLTIDPEITIAQNYVKFYEKKLNRSERCFIEGMNQTYYSFYSVLKIEVEKLLVVKDIMLGTTHTIKERQGTYHLKRGDVIFSRILTLDHQSIFVGMAPFIVPTSYHQNLIDFKKGLIEKNEHHELNPEVLCTIFNMELIDYFFEIMKIEFNKPLPILFNTDGDLLQISKSYFALTIKPEEVLNKLLPLTLSDDPNEF